MSQKVKYRYSVNNDTEICKANFFAEAMTERAREYIIAKYGKRELKNNPNLITSFVQAALFYLEHGGYEPEGHSPLDYQ